MKMTKQKAGWLTKQLEDKEFRESYFQKLFLEEFLSHAEKRMKELKISRSELARKLGISRSVVTKWFSCADNITLKTAANIARVLGCTIKMQLVEDVGAK